METININLVNTIFEENYIHVTGSPIEEQLKKAVIEDYNNNFKTFKKLYSTTKNSAE
jgi:hypothetical protein